MLRLGHPLISWMCHYWRSLTKWAAPSQGARPPCCITPSDVIHCTSRRLSYWCSLQTPLCPSVRRGNKPCGPFKVAAYSLLFQGITWHNKEAGPAPCLALHQLSTNQRLLRAMPVNNGLHSTWGQPECCVFQSWPFQLLLHGGGMWKKD